MWPFNKQTTEKEIQEYSPSLVFSDKGTINLLEQFKGEVENSKVTFPEELGEEHPFDFKTLENLYKKFGFFTAVVDKYIDYIVGPGFYIECKDDRAKELIEKFMVDVNLDKILRDWIKETLVKGNGFIEIGGNVKKGIEGLKVLNANNMYVNRNKLGKIKGYNQYKGKYNIVDKNKLIPFEPYQIAFFPFNKIGDCVYGLGIGYPALVDINNMLQIGKDSHFLMKRKANSPIHAQMGYINGDTKIIPKPADVAKIGKDLENLSNKTEWATDILTNFKVIDYGNIGEKFDVMLQHDVQQLMYIFQIPPELMGMANIPEGMSKVRMDSFQRRIQSIQAEAEKIVEQQIFKRVLKANGLDVHVEFQWGTASSLAVEGRMTLISEIIKSPTTSFEMKNILEDELINLLKLDVDKWTELKVEGEEIRKRELETPQPIVPGQNQKIPQKVLPKAQQPKQPKPQAKGIIPLKEVKKKIKKVKDNRHYYEFDTICPHCIESWEDLNDVSEWLNFNYKKYLGSILGVIKADEFINLSAANAIEEQAGYLSEAQVGSLKKVFETGFKEGQGIKDIAKNIDKKVGIPDLYKMENGKLKLGKAGLPILQRSAEKRSVGIARTEVTRLANMGAIEQYKDNNIKKIRWVASFGERTCPICEDLNDQIFKIGNVPPIPAHAMCRCTVAPVVELI